MEDIQNFIFNKENRRVLIIALILLIAIPLTFYLVRQTQIFKSRALGENATLTFTGPNVTPGPPVKTTSQSVNLRLSFAGEPSPTPALPTSGQATVTPGPSSTPGPSPTPSRTSTPSPTGSALSCQTCTVGEICAKISQGTLPNVIKECKYIPDSQGGMNVDVLLSSAQVTNNQATLLVQFYLGTAPQLGTPVTKILNIAGTSATATPGPSSTPGPGTPTVAPATATPRPPTNTPPATTAPTAVPGSPSQMEIAWDANFTRGKRTYPYEVDPVDFQLDAGVVDQTVCARFLDAAGAVIQNIGCRSIRLQTSGATAAPTAVPTSPPAATTVPTAIPTFPPAAPSPIGYRVFKDAIGLPNIPDSAILTSGFYNGADVETGSIDLSSLGSPGEIVTVYAQFKVSSNGVETWEPPQPILARIRIPFPPTTGCIITGDLTIGMNEAKVYFAEPQSNTDCNGLSSGPGSCSWTLLETNTPYQEIIYGHNNPQDLRPFGMGVVNPGSYRLTYVQTGGGDNNVANRDCSKDITISP